MRPKNALNKLKPLLHAPSFTSEEARSCGVSSSTLAYYVKQHELTRIGHGIYRGANAPVSDDFRWEDLIEAMQRVKEGVICLTSALSLYHLTKCEIPHPERGSRGAFAILSRYRSAIEDIVLPGKNTA